LQGGATRAMPGRIGEERRRRRRPCAAATACGGWPFAPDSIAAKRFLLKKTSLASRVAKGQTRRPHPFFSSLLEPGFFENREESFLEFLKQARRRLDVPPAVERDLPQAPRPAVGADGEAGHAVLL